MGVDPGRLPEDSVRPSESGRHRSAGPGGAEPAGFDSSGFERNGVDRIPESDRTSTPWTFFVIFIGGSVGLGAVAFGWVGHDVRAGPVGDDLRDRRRHRGRGRSCWFRWS